MGLSDWLAPVKFQKNQSTYKFSPGAKIVALWLIVISALLLLYFTRHILPVFIWAMVSAYLFNPLITFLSEKTKIHRALWILTLYFLLGILLVYSVNKFMPIIANEVSDIASLINKSPQQTDSFLGSIASRSNISIFGFNMDVKEIVRAVYFWVNSQIPSHAVTIFFGAIERFVYLLIYFIVTFYFLLDSGKIFKLFEEMIPRPYRDEISELLDRMNITLGAYIRAQIVLIFIMTFASFIVLSVLKIKYAFILSVMTGILEVIPLIGPIVATFIVSVAAFFQINIPFGLNNGTLVMLVIGAYFILRQLEDYFIIPNVASRFVKVHPVVGIFALMTGAMSGGVLGIFLAIPTAAIIKVFLNYIHNKLIED